MAGYIGTTPVPQATQHRESFTATGGQTSFATAGYTPQFIDVYLNGVKLAPADYTATNGSDVVLASGATASDILEIVAYTPFEVANQTFTGDTSVTNLAVTGTFTSRGIDDNADAVAITIDSSENVGIGTSSPVTSYKNALQVHGADGGGNIRITNDTTGTGTGNGFEAVVVGVDAYLIQREAAPLIFYTSNTERMRIDSNGNTTFKTSAGHLSVEALGGGSVKLNSNGSMGMNVAAGYSYEIDVGGSEVMRIDASGNVGISNSSPSSQTAGAQNLVVGTSGATGITIASSNNNNGSIFFADGTSGNQGYRGYLQYNHTSDFLTIGTAATERMRIDSSGNLLVGKTTIATGTAGIALRSNGEVRGTANGDYAARFSRLSSDGAIVGFEKDNVAVGSIGSVVGTRASFRSANTVGYLGVGSTDYYGFKSTAFVPTTTGSYDLGGSAEKFKDLYLSGGVYLGGTGAANKLEDYEEGTWTPTISSGTFTAENAWYVKVGKLITISAKLSGFSDTSSGSSVTLGGVPFTTKASDHTAQGSMIADYLSNGPYFPYISNNATTIRFYIQSATNYTTMLHSNLGSSGSFYFTLTYQTQ